MRDILRGEKRMRELLARIEQRNAVVGVIGLGYVGLPLAVAFAQAGFQVIGFDVDSERVAALNEGISPIQDINSWTLQQVVQTNFQASTDFSRLAEVDTVSICVPTPLQKTKEPDISYVVNVTKHIASNLRPGQLVVLESTTYPGTTEELLQPMLEKTGLRAGSDFFLAFSPERIDPGNTQFSLQNTPKVVGGTTEQCTHLAVALYSTIVEQVVQVGSTKVAELVKLLENTYRSVNIGLANEFAQIAEILGVDIWEVIEAASSKPFGFVPFYPGPGPGGHCIPLDPYYLSWKLRSLHYRTRFIDVANEVNEEMPGFVVDQVSLALNEHGKCLNGSRILILGVAYKRDINDVRESPAIDVINQLHEHHAHVAYADQFVPELRLDHTTLLSQPLSEALLHAVDCVVIVTNHSTVDYAWVVEHSPLVIDTRNATGHIEGAEHVWRLTRPTGVQAAEEQSILLAS